MVHGRPSPAAQPVTRPARQAEPAAPGDLESELLNDLQASFAAVREAAAQPAAPPRPQPFVAPPAPTMPEPPRSRPQPQAPEPTYLPSSFAPRPQPQPAPPPPRLEPRPDIRSEGVRPEFRLEPFDESRLVPIPQPPVIQPSVPPGYAERVEQRASAQTEAPQRLFERPPQRPAAPSHEDEEFAAFQLRPSTPATAPVTTAPLASPQAAPPPAASRWEQPAPPPAPSRWEQPPQPEPHAVASRFAPPSAKEPEPEPQLDFDDEGLDPFAEAGLFPQTQLPNEDEFQSDEFGLAPDYAEDDEDPFPPLGEDTPAAAGARARPPRGLIIVAAVVAVALVGGLAVAMFRSGQNTAGAPATILADGAPTKITPDTTASPASSDADAQNKLIYDRVNSAEANNNTTLLTPDNGPIKDTSQSDANNPISRVILPGGPGYDQPAGGNAAAPASQPAPAADGEDALGPRKVRTVVVRPDGTILSSTASDASAADGGAAPAPATTADAAPAPAAPAPVTDDMAAISGTDGNALSITTDPDAASAPAIPPPAPAPAVKAADAPAPAPVKKPTQVAQAPAPATDANGPLDLTSGGNNAQPATAADGVFVQVSSQRTEDAARATYKDLQTRYPSILGKYGVDLQQADVPSRGTFYRVRVGPFSATDAQRLCDDLRSAGGDCVLARR
jgi:hypothetical protein